jgi:hypothetical protein
VYHVEHWSDGWYIHIINSACMADITMIRIIQLKQSLTNSIKDFLLNMLVHSASMWSTWFYSYNPIFNINDAKIEEWNGIVFFRCVYTNG